MISATIAICAFIIDMIIGDPHSNLHPVAIMGRCVSVVEKTLLRADQSKCRQRIAGALFTIILLTFSYACGYFIVWEFNRLALSWWLQLFLEALCLSFMISPKSLMQAGQGIIYSLQRNNLIEARQKVHFIVGRDTDNMDEQEIVRATVETIAENTTDGIISPLFYFFVGGLPLAILYRMVNTLDSMVGYKNDKYQYFGTVSARVDDLFNLIPARLTGLLIIIAAAILHLDYKAAWRMMRRDAKKHPSPNGGFAEATVAGALNIRLGGKNFYFGVPHFRAYMGDMIEKLSTRHIISVTQIMYTVTVLFIALIIVSVPFVPTWWHSGF